MLLAISRHARPGRSTERIDAELCEPDSTWGHGIEVRCAWVFRALRRAVAVALIEVDDEQDARRTGGSHGRLVGKAQAR